VGGGQLRQWADVYIRNQANLGYARAVNQGMKLSDDIAVIANNDIRVSPNWWTVTEEIIKNPAVATLHFRMLPYESPFLYGDEVSISGREKWCSGSFFVKTKPVLFDEDYLNSYDDWDYQYRLRKMGYCTAYTNKACYLHMDSFTQQRVPDREKNNERNREYFKKKHGEYPEDLWTRDFPEQVNKPWKPFP
jgi:GT2 family glycosyltransferase